MGFEGEVPSKLNAETLKEEIITLGSKLEESKKQLRLLEEGIFAAETEYLRETQTRGNVIRGWETFWRRADKSSGISHARKLKNMERIFSQSSSSGQITQDEAVLDARTSRKNLISSSGIVKKKKLKKKSSDSD